MSFAIEQFVNKAQSQMVGSLNNSATTLTLLSAASFPTQGNFRIRVDTELMLCTAVSGNVLTVTRGIEGTTAASHAAGAAVTATGTAAGLKNNPLGMTAAFDEPYLDSSGNQNRLPANTSATLKVKTSQGDGTNPAAPQWTDPATLTVGHASTADSAAALSATNPVNKGGTGLATIPAHSVPVGNGTSAMNTVGPANSSRLLTSGGSSADPAFTTAAPLGALANDGSAIWPTTQLVGNNPTAPVAGYLRASSPVTIMRGCATVDYPNQNPSGQNFNAFGDGIKLQSGISLTFWAQQTADAVNDGASTIYGAISYNDGGSWSTPFVIYRVAGDGPTYNVAVSGGLGQDSKGRIFASLAIYGNATPITSYLIWTDDPTGQTGWTAPNFAKSMADPGYPNYYFSSSPILELSDGLGPNGSGTLIAVGFGPIDQVNKPSFKRQTTMIQSVNRGVDWTHRSNVAIPSGPMDQTNIDYIEPRMAFRPDGKIIVTMRQQQLLATVFAVSTDLGATDGNWTVSSVAAGTYVPIWSSTPICTLDNGRMAIMGRDSQVSTVQENVLYTCLDGSGMNVGSWGAPQYFDYRHYQNEYGGIWQIRKNVIGCVFAGSLLPARTSSDWTFISFADGMTHQPPGNASFRSVQTRRLADLWQTTQPIPDPIQKIPSPSIPAEVKVNALIDRLTSVGSILQHPADGGLLAGSWPTWKVPSNVNDYINNFIAADSASVVPNSYRNNNPNSINIAPTQPKGTWGISGDQLYLSATTGGSGYNPHIIFNFGKGDGTATLACASFSAPFCIVLRWIDANNMLLCYVDGTNARFYKIVSGSATQLATVALSIGAVPVVLECVANANILQLFANINGAGFPTTPQLSYTLTGSDATTFANTNTTWGILEFATSANRFTSFDFSTGPLVLGTPQTVGESFGEITEIGGTAAGSLLQTTVVNQGTLQIDPFMGRNKYPWVRLKTVNGSNKVFYKTGTFAALPGPYTVFWTGSMPVQPGGPSGLFLISDGVNFNGALSFNNAAAGSVSMGGQSGHFFTKTNIFPAYPFGRPAIFRAVFNKTSSELWMDGQLLASGQDTGSWASGITSIQMGDAVNISGGKNCFDLTVFYGVLLTPLCIHEMERYLTATLEDTAWNDRASFALAG